MARTPKAQALGAALRQAREDRELLLRELAAMIKRDIGVVSRWETGDRAPKPEQVAQILTKLEVDGERYDEIMTLAYGTNESQWVAISLPEQRQQLAALVDWEHRASRIVEVAPLLIPGILQTSDYIRGIMTAAGVPEDEIALRVASRLGRADAITRRKPADLLVLLGHAALNQDIGGRATMLGQLDHLLEMAARPNIELRIVPDHRGWHPGLDGRFVLIDAARPASARRAAVMSASIVFVATRRSDLMLHEEQDVAAYRRALDQVLDVSLAPEPSAKFISEVRKRMEKQ
ncbi:helix-turn-helix domain-containing protein [Actinophytocola algeriensis]|uniref:Transcriptional regulator with XRE-family HTH domain n=1 Tax=Actinophytocola algeriensis TaxID=1768010 RepID=A0A7W7Q6W3_9PSEU|nr:helix-turn-helix transcriptional regulator [Actinophytocola algeriensis]MBB4907766.1 transcriptional regulator with XRE-family HTH domain [Actinophytocola algeriensis]MBE1479796.1 transcriptional regulator with XRE-family HTH domain [Actinophytocola algeriensis]